MAIAAMGSSCGRGQLSMLLIWLLLAAPTRAAPAKAATVAAVPTTAAKQLQIGVVGDTPTLIAAARQQQQQHAYKPATSTTTTRATTAAIEAATTAAIAAVNSTATTAAPAATITTATSSIAASSSSSSSNLPESVVQLLDLELTVAPPLNKGHDGLKLTKKKQLQQQHFHASTTSSSSTPATADHKDNGQLLPVANGYLGPIFMGEKIFSVAHPLKKPQPAAAAAATQTNSDTIETQLREGRIVEILAPTALLEGGSSNEATGSNSNNLNSSNMATRSSSSNDSGNSSSNNSGDSNSNDTGNSNSKDLSSSNASNRISNNSNGSSSSNISTESSSSNDSGNSNDSIQSSSNDSNSSSNSNDSNSSNSMNLSSNSVSNSNSGSNSISSNSNDSGGNSSNSIGSNASIASSNSIGSISSSSNNIDSIVASTTTNRPVLPAAQSVLSTTVFQVPEQQLQQQQPTTSSSTRLPPAAVAATAEQSVPQQTSAALRTESKISDIQIEVYDSTVDSIVASTNFRDTQGYYALPLESSLVSTKPPTSNVLQERFTQYVIDRADVSTQPADLGLGKPQPAAIEIHINVSEAFGNESEDLEFSYRQPATKPNKSNNSNNNDEILVVEIIDSNENISSSASAEHIFNYPPAVRPPQEADELFMAERDRGNGLPRPPHPPPPPPLPRKPSIDRDSDTIFYISNTEVKVGESLPTPSTSNVAVEQQQQRKLQLENQFFPASYKMEQQQQQQQQQQQRSSSEDILLSPLHNTADALKILRSPGLSNDGAPPLDVTYVGESVIEVEQQALPSTQLPALISPSIQQQPQSQPQPDIIIEPAVLPDLAIGVPVIGELPPQIELKEIDYMPGELLGQSQGIYENDIESNSLGLGQDNEVLESSIQYGGDLIDDGAGGGFDGVEGSYPFDSPAHRLQQHQVVNGHRFSHLHREQPPVAELLNATLQQQQQQHNDSGNLADLGGASAMAPLQHGGHQFFDTQTIIGSPEQQSPGYFNIIAVIVGLVMVVLAAGLLSTMYCAVRYFLNKNATSSAAGDDSEQGQGQGQDSKQEDISRNARETKMHTDKDGVFVVEVARGIDSKQPPDSPAAALNVPATAGDVTELPFDSSSSSSNNVKLPPNHEQVQIHAPPSDFATPLPAAAAPAALHLIEEESLAGNEEEPEPEPEPQPLQSAATGLSQSDLSSTSSSDSNKRYSYGNQELYVIDQPGYVTNAPTVISIPLLASEEAAPQEQQQQQQQLPQVKAEQQQQLQKTEQQLPQVKAEEKQQQQLQAEKQLEEQQTSAITASVAREQQPKLETNNAAKDEAEVPQNQATAAEETVKQTETETQGDDLKETQQQPKAETQSETETQGEAAKETQLETKTESQKQNEQEAKAQTPKEALKETASVTKAETQSEALKETPSETKAETQQATQIAAQKLTSNDTKAETQKEVLEDTQSKTQAETQQQNAAEIEAADNNIKTAAETDKAAVEETPEQPAVEDNSTAVQLTPKLEPEPIVEPENSYDSLMSLPAPPSNEEIKELSDYALMESNQLDSLPPPPPPPTAVISDKELSNGKLPTAAATVADVAATTDAEPSTLTPPASPPASPTATSLCGGGALSNGIHAAVAVNGS